MVGGGSRKGRGAASGAGGGGRGGAGRRVGSGVGKQDASRREGWLKGCGTSGAYLCQAAKQSTRSGRWSLTGRSASSKPVFTAAKRGEEGCTCEVFRHIHSAKIKPVTFMQVKNGIPAAGNPRRSHIKEA